METPDLFAEALATFDRLTAQAAEAGEPDPTAMAVATAALDARPSLRMVLLKAHDARGFVFYTHMDGRKGRELQSNPQAALLFHWPRIRNGVQVRIEGDVQVVADDEADAYFASRARGSQIGAWSSPQSTTLERREDLLERVHQTEERFGDAPIPRPPFWSGFRVVPHRIEFWSAGEFRLHDRLVYQRTGDGEWSTRSLYP